MCEIDEESNKIKGTFVSDNVFNLSRRNISLLSKGLSFVPMRQKIDPWQVKTDLQKFDRNIILKMHFLNELSPLFSEVPALKTPSKRTPIIKDIQLELYL